MKKLLLVASLFMAPAAFAGQGVVYVENNPQVIQQTVQLINSGNYRGRLNDNCGPRWAKRSVYKVTIKNASYRVDRYGNLQPVASKAVIKYSCAAGDDD